jgi:hypothetical protein
MMRLLKMAGIGALGILILLAAMTAWSIARELLTGFG